MIVIVSLPSSPGCVSALPLPDKGTKTFGKRLNNLCLLDAATKFQCTGKEATKRLTTINFEVCISSQS